MSGLNPRPTARIISLAKYSSSASFPVIRISPSSLLICSLVFVSCSMARFDSPFLPMSTATRSFGMRSSYENSSIGGEVIFFISSS